MNHPRFTPEEKLALKFMFALFAFLFWVLWVTS